MDPGVYSQEICRNRFGFARLNVFIRNGAAKIGD